jgi:hypothetical protein
VALNEVLSEVDHSRIRGTHREPRRSSHTTAARGPRSRFLHRLVIGPDPAEGTLSAEPGDRSPVALRVEHPERLAPDGGGVGPEPAGAEDVGERQ